MSIILLRGFSHSGKDYVGNILCKTYGFMRFAFADSLKKMVAETFGCSLEQLHSQEGKLQICESDSQKRTFRQILIDEALRLRNIDYDIFAKFCAKDIKQSESKNIVITDWRYPNELNILRNFFPDFKILTVHIVRENQIESPVNDISEYHLDSFKDDLTIFNKMDNSIYLEIRKLVDYLKTCPS